MVLPLVRKAVLRGRHGDGHAADRIDRLTRLISINVAVARHMGMVVRVSVLVVAVTARTLVVLPAAATALAVALMIR